MRSSPGDTPIGAGWLVFWPIKTAGCIPFLLVSFVVSFV